jgi:hypothetical protein
MAGPQRNRHFRDNRLPPGVRRCPVHWEAGAVDHKIKLAAAAADGDESAFAELSALHRRELHVHCYRMLASFDEAEDAVQETLLRAWRGRSGLSGGQPRAWLYRIATNV